MWTKSVTPGCLSIEVKLPPLAAASDRFYPRHIDFFVYSRAAPGAADVEDPALNEEHWSYMDGFADGMIARGPTLAADRSTWTGSVHIVDLASAEAAHEFVEREPYNRAGLFEHHVIRRFKNLLGRTMWEFPGTSDGPRFMVMAHALAEAGEQSAAVRLPDLAGLDEQFDVEILDWEFGGRR